MNLWSALLSSGSATVGTPTSWQVTQRAAGTNMSVDVAPGTGLLPGASFPYAPWSDATVNKTVTTADPSNPRRDIVVAYLDMSVPSTAANNAPAALKFMVVAGTPNASPTDPNSSAIQTAVGNGNPWVYLARIRIGTPGAYVAPSVVTNSMIDDLRQPISFKGRLWGGSSNTNGHIVPNVADDTVALVGAGQTFTGNNTFSGTVTFTKTPIGLLRLGLSKLNSAGAVIPNAYTTYNTVTATSTGNEIEIMYGAQIKDGTSGVARTGHIRVQCDGTTVTDSDVVWQTTISGQYLIASMLISHTPAAGSHTWTLQVEADSASASTLYQTYLRVQESR